MARTFADLIRYNTLAIMTVVFGDMLGYPIPCYYKLRFLPIFMNDLEGWRTFMLKERDITEKMR